MISLQIAVITMLIWLATFVLHKRPKHLPALLLALMCFLTATWVCFDIATTLAESNYNLNVALIFRNASKLCTTHLVATFVCFAWFFPDQHIIFRRWKMVLLFLASLSFSILAFTTWDVRTAELLDGQLQIEYGVSHYAYSVYIILAGLYAMLTLWHRHQHVSSQLVRLQLKYTVLGLGITFILSTTFSVVLPTFFHIYDYFSIGTLAPLVGFVGMAYAIVRHRAMDIRTAVHYTLSWLLVTSFILLPIYWVIFFLRIWLSKLSNFQLSFVATGLFWTFFFYVRRVQPFIDRLFHRDFRLMQAGIEKLIAQTAPLQSFSQLGIQVERTIQEYLHLPNALLLVRNVEGNFTSTEQSTQIGVRLSSVSKQDPFIKWLSDHQLTESAPEILSLNDVIQQSSDETVIVAAENYFKKMTVQLCLPLTHKRTPDKKTQNPTELVQLIGTLNFRQEWLKPRQTDLVLRLRGAITMAIDNAYLHQFKLKSRENQTQAELISTAASALAHSIKNPLGLLDANIDMLKSSLPQNTNDNVAFALKDISQQVSRIDHIIKQIRNADIVQPDLQKYRLASILREALTETARLYPHRVFTTEIDESAEIFADRIQLRLALANLLTNACESLLTESSENRIRPTSEISLNRLHVSVERDLEDFKIEIRDNGSGMTPKLVTKVMNQPFITRKKNGTGLGLWTAKKIIESHTGRLQLASKLNVGTTVTIFLPSVNTQST